MQIASIFIEYFVTGTSLYVGLLISKKFSLVSFPEELILDQNKILMAVALIPAFLIFGIIIDFVARKLVWKSKKLIKWIKETPKKMIKKENNTEEPTRKPKKNIRILTLAEIFYHSPELGKQYEIRSTRDRIARGAFTNIVIILLLIVIHLVYNSDQLLLHFLGISILLLFATLFYLVWERCERLSRGFKYKASKVIRRQMKLKKI
jgi:hypothetical protein